VQVGNVMLQSEVKEREFRMRGYESRLGNWGGGG
jgi:hypothetical protein